jgi:uncharacterized protein
LVVMSAFFVNVSAGQKEALAAMDKGDYQIANKEFTALAEKGDASAMISIGLLFHEGKGFKQDYDKAMEWYLKAFKVGNGDAYNNIGVMYRDGLGVEKNLEIAYGLFWITYWRGLGSEETQYRVGRNVGKINPMMKPEEIEQALNVNEEYVLKYVENRGKLDEKEKALKSSKDGHRIKQLGDLKASASKRESFKLLFELRVPKAVKLDPLTRIEVVTDEGSYGTRLNLIKQKEVEGYVIMADSTLIFSEERRAVVVKPDKQFAQVFRLTIPQLPMSAGWVQWQRPNYIEMTDASWTFMHGLKSFDRSTNIPPDSFELRYKIEKSAEP